MANEGADSIGNAKISGMETDLDLSSNEYSISLVVFFIGYVVFEVPSKYVPILSSIHQVNNNSLSPPELTCRTSTVFFSAEFDHRYSYPASWHFGER